MSTIKNFDIFNLISQLDKNNYKFILNLNENELKNIQPYIIQRYMSSGPSQNKLNQYFLITTYEINKDLWKCSNKIINLLLLASIGTGRKEYHKWIKNNKISKNKDKLVDVLTEVYQISELEAQIIIKNTKKELILDELAQKGIQL